MLEGLVSVGQQMARAFVDTNQDIFVMVADVDGQDITVTVKFAPVAKKVNITREGVWNMLTERMSKSNQTLT